MKVLNLYAGIGGNRKLWENVQVTAVEWDQKIAKVYQSFFPDDNVIIADAHQYLLEHYRDYDFIWSSPPCPTHSRFTRIFFKNNEERAKKMLKYPDMSLYQEIILLKNFFNGKFCVENVQSYYDPLITPQIYNGHYYWANFIIRSKKNHARGMYNYDFINKPVKIMAEELGFDINKIKNVDKAKVLNNCVDPESGKLIMECAMGKTQLVLC